MNEFQKIAAMAARSGLTLRGAFALDDAERRGPLADTRTIALLGMVGAGEWPAFEAAPEYADGAPDPLDRWSRRVIDALARDLGGVALYPFGGPPYWPFQRWAQRAEPVFPSPLGLLIHPEYGLWHSYRGALGLREALDPPPRAAAASPCDSCAERPCLTSCPVGAFSTAGYDVETCAAHLRRPQGGACVSRGCLARSACPIGRNYAHGEVQAAFHMRAFLRARGGPG